MSYSQFDVVELTNGDIYLHVSAKFYNLSITNGGSNARSRLPHRVARKVGSLYGQGPNLAEYFAILQEAGDEVSIELPLEAKLEGAIASKADKELEEVAMWLRSMRPELAPEIDKILAKHSGKSK